MTMADQTSSTHDKRFPNESDDYRAARNALLAAEQELRANIEAVAQLRRQLPAGGLISEDYEFEELDLADGSSRPVRLSELFGDKTDLIAYSYMYGPDWERPCPSCTSVIDGIEANSRHIRQEAELVVIGKAPPEKLYDMARERRWRDLRLLSSWNNSYTRDYLSQPGDSTESLIPLMNVFQKSGGEVRHFWGSELFFTPLPDGHPRHIDVVWPLWGLLDLTRSGRGDSGIPKLEY